MKRGELVTAIKNLAGNPWINVTTPLGVMPKVAFQKGSLVDGIMALFTEGKAQETGIKLLPSGHLVREDYEGE